MKYKILINGKLSTLLKDFFMHTDSDFICLSTSSLWEDITNHIDVFKPDAYLCFYEQSDDNMLNQLQSLKNSKKYSRIPIIAIGDNDSCEMFSKKAPYLSALKIKKSVSYQNMADQIKKYIAEHAAAAEKKEEAAKAEAIRKQTAPPQAAALDISLDDLKKFFEEGTDAKKHILVVDDDRGVLKMLKNALDEKYEVTTMVNGKMIEKFLETKTADLILLDYEMPEESGAEIFKRLRLQLKAKKIPVIFLTGVADSNKIKEVLALKPRGYLLKPIDMGRLMTAIEAALG